MSSTFDRNLEELEAAAADVVAAGAPAALLLLRERLALEEDVRALERSRAQWMSEALSLRQTLSSTTLEHHHTRALADEFFAKSKDLDRENGELRATLERAASHSDETAEQLGNVVERAHAALLRIRDATGFTVEELRAIAVQGLSIVDAHLVALGVVLPTERPPERSHHARSMPRPKLPESPK